MTIARDYERRAQTSNIGFKAFLTTRLDLPRDAKEIFTRSFIGDVLKASAAQTPDTSLVRAVHALTAELTSAE